MKKLIQNLILVTASFVGVSSTLAAVSPHETISATVDGDKITITYGRPYTKNPRSGEMRKIWGGLVPYGKVWRTGADAATILTTEKDIVIGDTTVPAGKYSLYTFPVADGTSKLVINKKTGQWGIPYPAETEKEELARVDLKKEMLDQAVDQFTMAVESAPGGGGVIKMSWEKTQYSVAFKVKQ